MQNLVNLISAIATVPSGAWAVGVSGGADSVALLSMLRMRKDLSLRVAHLDHQTRQGASEQDALFVQSLAMQWGLPCEVARLDQILPTVADPPKNPSARFRAARLAFFRRIVTEHGLGGVILAHHAQDQAETILLRLLRGSGYAGLTGMAGRSEIAGLTILRPLLHVSPATLREHLREIGQVWREDQSNQSAAYARNRVRPVLARCPELTRSLIELGESCTELRKWSSDLPEPPETLELTAFQNLPTIFARELARRWLIARGATAEELSPEVLDRLIAMACDRATPRRQQFPGGITVARRGERLLVPSPSGRGLG